MAEESANQITVDAGSEEVVSILGNGESGTVNIRRYQVQYDGNSSEEDDNDINNCVSERKESNEDACTIEPSADGGEDAIGAGYEQLGNNNDDFGDFICSNDLTNDKNPQEGSRSQTFFAKPSRDYDDTNQHQLPQLQNTTRAFPTSGNNATPGSFISVSPLTTEKIEQIKKAMASINVKIPNNSGAVAIADAIERRKLRVGDEIKTA